VGNGRATRFWHDVWVGNVPLRINYPSMFRVTISPDASVAANYDLDSHTWDIGFRRDLGSADMVAWEHLLGSLDSVFLSDQNDRVIWALKKNGEYSTKSIYKWGVLKIKQAARRVFSPWGLKLGKSCHVVVLFACRRIRQHMLFPKTQVHILWALSWFFHVTRQYMSHGPTVSSFLFTHLLFYGPSVSNLPFCAYPCFMVPLVRVLGPTVSNLLVYQCPRLLIPHVSAIQSH
jgi:hypothetical protein